jgi:signal transduction histidine kinase
MSEVEKTQYALPIAESISAESLQKLLDISTKLGSTLHLDDLLSLVMDVATELTQTQRASILLVDRTTGDLHFAASTDGKVPKDIVVPLDGSIAGWVVRNGRSVILGDVRTDERFYSSVDEELEWVTRSMLAVPLVTKKGVIGALEVLNKEDNAAYSGQDVALMEALAAQSATAIMNAYLFNQSDLVAEIMHELKTPLMAITAACDLIVRPDLPQEKHGELTGMIKRESMRLSKMTRDFLEFARLESGRERLAREPIELVSVINDVVHITQSQAEARHITIIAEIAPDLPTAEDNPTLIGDSDRVKQVLLNLVSNATKYNVDGGRITINAHMAENVIVINVVDTGRGIAEEDIGHLFERFYRIPGSEELSEGSGMGLAIANKIVEELGGHIEVASVLGEGTTFTVRLPLSPLE